MEVEFLGAEPLADEPRGCDPRTSRPRGPVLAGALVLLLTVGAGVTWGRARADVVTGRPSSYTVNASPQMQALFNQHLPGSIVVDESSVVVLDVATGAQTVQRRLVKIVYGNVEITVTVLPRASAPTPANGTAVVHGTYLIRFGFAGYYPPTPGQLRSIADDSRLTSPSA